MAERTADFNDLLKLYKAGDPARALAACLKALGGVPTAALHRLAGRCASDLGRREEAIGHFREALVLAPRSAETHVELGRTEEAIQCYERAIRIDPRFAPGLVNLGLAYQSVGRLSEAFDCYQKAVAIAPDMVEGHFNLGNLLRHMNQLVPAAESFQAALRLAPNLAAGWRNLASTLQGLGRLAEARDAYQRALALDPAHVGAQHMLAALEQRPSDAPPSGYVRDLFDGYADTFEQDVLTNLHYRIPELIGARLKDRLSKKRIGRALDLGCGTGLIGLNIKPLVDRLEGLDVAPNMVAIARSRGVYDQVVSADGLEHLRFCPAGDYDLVTAADVLIYVGASDGWFREIARLLRSGGLFAFSVESCPGEHFRLGTAGRYQHSDAYIAACAAEAGLTILSQEETPIRKERGEGIPGKLYFLAKP
jgi:predicted TPR repeat methyltransferase